MGILNLFKSGKSHVRQNADFEELNKNAATGRVEEIQEFREVQEVQEVKAMDTEAFLQSDDKEWIRYLGQALRTHRKPGVTLKEEHDIWMAARIRSRAGNIANARTAGS